MNQTRLNLKQKKPHRKTKLKFTKTYKKTFF